MAGSEPEPQPEPEEIVPTAETAQGAESVPEPVGVPELALASSPESTPEPEEVVPPAETAPEPESASPPEPEPIPEPEAIVPPAETVADQPPPAEEEPREEPGATAVEPPAVEPVSGASEPAVESPTAEPPSGAVESAPARSAGLPDTAPPPVWGAAGGTGPAPLSGGYTLLRELARGGSGVTYLALDTALRRRVVLKTLRDDLVRHDDLLARFVREIRVTAALEHPNITRLYSWGTRDGVPFMVLEHLEGGTLLELLTMHGAGWNATLFEPLAQVCDGLHYAHSRGVVHRDVKLSNVFVSAAGRGAIFDWGIAHVFAELAGDDRFTDGAPGADAAGRAAASEERFWGTPAYMAPEQARGDFELIGPQTDVFAIGANLFHLATGYPPGDGTPVADLFRARADGDGPRLRDVKPKAPPELDEICARAMAFLPEDRYPSAAALGAEIRDFLAAQAAASEW
jgi:hypothetical protein